MLPDYSILYSIIIIIICQPANNCSNIREIKVKVIKKKIKLKAFWVT